MEIDIQIKNATLEDLQQMFSKAPAAVAYKITVPDKPVPQAVPVNDHREENLGRAAIPSDELKVTAQKKIKALAPKGKNKNQSRSGIPGWTHEEIDLINACPDYIEAWVAYQKVFTDRRNRNAVTQRWNKLHPKKRGEEPSEISLGTVPGSTLVIQGADDLIDEMPEEPTGEPAEIRPGVRVKQTGGTKICAGIGTVKRCPNGKDEVLVAFDKGMEWMERKNLSLVST
jgi:hypothetical protein